MKYIKYSTKEDAAECIQTIMSHVDYNFNRFTVRYCEPIEIDEEFYVPVATTGKFKCDDLFEQNDFVEMPIETGPETEEDSETE